MSSREDKIWVLQDKQAEPPASTYPPDVHVIRVPKGHRIACQWEEGGFVREWWISEDDAQDRVYLVDRLKRLEAEYARLRKEISDHPSREDILARLADVGSKVHSLANSINYVYQVVRGDLDRQFREEAGAEHARLQAVAEAATSLYAEFQAVEQTPDAYLRSREDDANDAWTRLWEKHAKLAGTLAALERSKAV